MPPHPVFVDGSGRRARWFVRACWTVGALLSAYVALMVVALVAPAGVIGLGLGPLLPRPQAPRVAVAGGREPLRQLLGPDVALSPSATPTPTPVGSSRASSAAVRPGPAPVRASATAQARPSATPTAGLRVPRSTTSPAPRTSPTASAPGRSADHPQPHASRTPPARGLSGR